MATQFNANTFDAINNIAQHYGTPTNIVSAIQDIKDSRNPLGSNFTFENALDTSSAVLSSYQAIQSSFGTLIQLAKATPSPGRVLLDIINLEITLGSMANSAFTEQKIDSSDVYSALATVASIGSTLAFGTALAASSPLWASAAVALTVAGVGLSYAGMMNGDDTIDVTNALQSIADFSQKAGDSYDAAYVEFQQAVDWTGKTIEQLNSEIQPVIQDIETYAEHISDVLGDALADGYYDSKEFIENTLSEAGDWYNDLTNWFNTATKLLPPPVFIDPIIVDLDGDGIEMIPRQNNNVFFDMDGDGLKEWTGWINKDDAFLAIDENNNGIIDSVKELIGEQNTSGFTEFKNYDSNGDKVFDNKDTLWSQIKVWQDLNTDGISDANELKTLADVGIKSIDLHYTAINLTAAGNQIHETSIFERTDGTTGTIVDAWLDVDRIAASITQTATGNVTIDTLPDIRGFGNVSSLHNAMLNDSALATLVSTAVTLSADQINNLRDSAEQIIYRWAEVQDVASNSRGANFDGRKLAVLEKFVGHNFVNTLNQTNPNVQATPLLNNAWEKLLDSVQARLAIEGAFKGILPIVYDVGADRFISLLDTNGVISTLKNAQPSDTLQAAKYWGAFIPVINRIVDDAGDDSTSLAHIAKVTATLADIGLGKFQNFLVSGVESATLPSSGSFATNGAYTLSDSSETITLTGATQAIYALGGNDILIAKAPNTTATFVLDGGNGDDVLRGSDNSDWLNGGAGADSMFGSVGDDIYFVDNMGDVVRENRAEGNDTVRSDLSYILGNNLENLELFGTGDFYGTGNALVNKIIGNAGANILTGYEGNDILDGGSNADTLIGGIGNDTYVLDNTGDDVVEKYNEGIDTVQSTFSYVLANSLENLVLVGLDNINAIGNAANNVMTGNAGNNILDGKSGNDTLAGKAGDDIYWVNSKDDTVSEVANEGVDTINSSVAFTLGVNLENLTLAGETDINGIGNILNNHLIGNSGANSLDGKTGVDTLEGGASDDTYTVDNNADVVVEINDVGIDTVNSSVTYALSDYVENLTLLTTKAINGTGNDLNNQIIGNVGVNSLMGGAGNDFLDGKEGADNLDGGIGDDIYIVDNTADKVIEGSNAGIDTIQSSVSWTLAADIENLTLSSAAVINATGNEQNNRLIGNAAKNVLDGQIGADVLFGLAGDDIYFIDNVADKVTENVNEGVDTVNSSLNYILGDNLENLTLSGSALKGTGNILNNTLVGNSKANVLTGYEGNDILDGGSGADILIGGIGNDTYVLDNTGDVVVEKYNEGIDSIQSNFSYVLANSLENLLLLGTDNINATGNAANNVITGNAGNNILDGKLGNDTLAGKAGDDIYWVDSAGDTVSEAANEGMDTVNSSVAFTLGVNVENLTLVGETDINGIGNTLNNHLIGNSGANSLDGKTGVDILEGGASDDSYTVDNTADVVIEINDVGIDTVNSSVTYALSDYVENLTLLTTTAINGTGNDLNNQIMGNAGSNSLIGAAGNDFLDGKAGADNLDGGIGDDIYVVENTADKVIEGSNAGIDTIQSSVSWTLAADIENLTLSGAAVINATGNEQNNRLIGNAAKNVLDGQIGADVLFGLAGDDIYFIDNVADKVTENVNEGVDTVNSSLNYILGDNLENLTLSGSALKGTGNILNNTLVGNSKANVLTGYEGNDILDGGSGVDTLMGGIGSDTYLIDNIKDIIVEEWNGGIDKDTVQSVISYALGKNLESLVLLGSDAINGLGNALNNSITGNIGDNILDGKSGNDTLNGGMGNDSYYVDSANDQLTEAVNAGTDNVYSSVAYVLGINVENLTLLNEDDINGTGNALNNILIGNSGANTLEGKAGADTLKGGLGDDTYYIDNTGDVVVEDANAGVDTISSTLSYTLNNIENLTLLGTAAINGTGNTADNILIGNTGNNSLIGGEGNDFLDGVLGADNLNGGTGDDIYVIDNVNDVLSEAINSGIDTVRSSLSHILLDNFENLILTGTAAIDANGNALENQITGNSAANVLDGKGGADTLVGLEGNDTYLIDNVGDSVWEGRNEGNDIVKSLFSYVLGDNLEQLVLQGTVDLIGNGNELANTLTGNAGANILNGSFGNDTLTGGAGFDIFQLTNAGNIDKITDFVVSDDTIQLDNAVFTSLGSEGVLLASQFRSGTGIKTAADSNDYLIYNSTDGKLYYDADGIGSNAAVQIALLGTGLVLTNADFIVI